MRTKKRHFAAVAYAADSSFLFFDFNYLKKGGRLRFSFLQHASVL